EGRVDRERERLGTTGEVPREGDRRAELAQGARPRQDRARRERGRDEGQGHAPHRGPPRGAEARGRLVEALVRAPQRALDAQDEERHRDEELGEDHGRGREGDRHAEPVVEVAAHEPAPAEHLEQRDPAHHGRQHERQRHGRLEDAPARKVAASEKPRERDTEPDPEHRRGERGPQREHEGLAHARGGEDLAEARPWRPQREGRERHDEEHDGERGWHQGERRDSVLPRVARRHGAPKPCRSSTARPAGESTSSVNAIAASGFGDPGSARTGYDVVASSSGGMSIAVTDSSTSVTYTIPASTSSRRTLTRTAVTSRSRVTGIATIPADARTRAAAAPHGTWRAHTAKVMPARSRSARSAIPASLARGTTRAIELVAKTAGERDSAPGTAASWRAATAVCIVAVLAAANTSAGAPDAICCARPELPPKLIVTSSRGW